MTDNKKKLLIAAAISLSFMGIVVLVMALLLKGVITFQLALLMLVALLGLYFGFGVLIFVYRFVAGSSSARRLCRGTSGAPADVCAGVSGFF